jgi:hypothetical protein
MNALDKQSFIRQRVIQNAYDPNASKILWSRHAVAALIDDGLHRTDVERALLHCEVIEDYAPEHRPLPDCLILATLANGGPVHAVIAVDEAHGRIFVVTVYVPTSDRWENDWRTRKR